MPQNGLLSRVRRTAWRIVPAHVLNLAFGSRLNGMRRMIETAGVTGAKAVEILGAIGDCYQISLEDGTQVISTKPSPNNIKITHLARRHLGLGPEYSKALVDLVVRYRFPHALVPILRIPVPERERGGFHLQHRHLPQETNDFSGDERAFLLQNFTPQKGWRILDVGCYLGHGTTHLAKLVGPAGRIIAVEAIPANAAIAASQLKANGISNTQVLNRAIWREAGSLVAMNTTENQANAIAGDVVSSPEKIDLPTTSIAELTNILGLPADLVSLTVNGAEVEAVDSLDTMPPELRPLRMVMPGWYPNGQGPRAKPLQAKLHALGYETLVTRHDFVIAWRNRPRPHQSPKGEQL